MKKPNTKSPLRTQRQAETPQRRTFSIEEIGKYIDPSRPEEAEEFVRLIYEERRQDGEETATE